MPVNLVLLAMDLNQTDQNPLSPRANRFSIASLISPEDRGEAEEALAAVNGTGCTGVSLQSTGDTSLVDTLEHTAGEWGLRYTSDLHTMEGLYGMEKYILKIYQRKKNYPDLGLLVHDNPT